MNIGNRIIYDQDGNIIYQTGEMSGDSIPPLNHITQLHYLDVPFGEIDYIKQRIVRVDVSSHSPVLEEIPVVLTPEQQRIQELENQLLLSSGVV